MEKTKKSPWKKTIGLKKVKNGDKNRREKHACEKDNEGHLFVIGNTILIDRQHVTFHIVGTPTEKSAHNRELRKSAIKYLENYYLWTTKLNISYINAM